jgi:hypothetical protein
MLEEKDFATRVTPLYIITTASSCEVWLKELAVVMPKSKIVVSFSNMRNKWNTYHYDQIKPEKRERDVVVAAPYIMRRFLQASNDDAVEYAILDEAHRSGLTQECISLLADPTKKIRKAILLSANAVPSVDNFPAIKTIRVGAEPTQSYLPSSQVFYRQHEDDPDYNEEELDIVAYPIWLNQDLEFLTIYYPQESSTSGFSAFCKDWWHCHISLTTKRSYEAYIPIKVPEEYYINATRESAGPQHKIVVFLSRTPVAAKNKYIYKRIQGYNCYRTYTGAKRGQVIDIFNESKEPGILFLPLSSCSTSFSINATDVFLFVTKSNMRSAAIYQARRRCIRLNSKASAVNIHYVSKTIAQARVAEFITEYEGTSKDTVSSLYSNRVSEEIFLKNLKTYNIDENTCTMGELLFLLHPYETKPNIVAMWCDIPQDLLQKRAQIRDSYR